MFSLLILVCILIIWYYFVPNTPLIEVATFDSGRPGSTIGIVGSVHGNEPAGAATLAAMGDALTPINGKVIAIMKANPLGLAAGTRMSPYGDINRHFSAAGDPYVSAILAALTPCDYVIDLHEGWGWHKISPASVGATISPNSAWPPSLIDSLLSAVNAKIADDNRKFTARIGKSRDIAGTLASHCENTHRPYLLIETAGQKDIQPLSDRVSQMRTIILSVMNVLGRGMIE